MSTGTQHVLRSIPRLRRSWREVSHAGRVIHPETWRTSRYFSSTTTNTTTLTDTNVSEPPHNDHDTTMVISDNTTPSQSASSTAATNLHHHKRSVVSLKDSPRSAAAARIRSTNAVKSQASGDYPAYHYMNGGTPCDPAPPPFHLAEYGEESLYTLVLLRHGESEWNMRNWYTGWTDVSLTKRGEMEARTAGRLLYENGIELDHAFTSVLKRASFSCNMALNAAKQHWVPVTKTWRLNERHYGALQGYHKDTAWKELNLCQELVMQMRRAYDCRPPMMTDDHPYWHGNDRRYRKLSPDQLERTRAESLKDTADRIMPFYNSVIVPSLRSGNKCIIVSHANTIRTLVKHIDKISDEDIKSMTIPTGIPLLYRLDKHMRPVDPQVELEFRYMVEPKGYTWGTSRRHGFHGVYLGDLERLQEIQRKRDVTNRDWQRIILRNIGKTLGWDMDVPESLVGPRTIEIRQLWWLVHSKLQLPDYRNMLLLCKMEDELEDLLHTERIHSLTKSKYASMIDKLHLDAEGKVVEPFVKLSEREDREERQRMFSDVLMMDLEEECLIK
jgi:2,3-bisphosphoglycerate-dependent phosphoglycerate mutase